MFGAATSSYQIEGTSFGGTGRSHWDQFAQKPGNVINGENGNIACDHYHRYQEDLDLLKGLQAYRFSTSWARVMPDGRGSINQAGLDFYDRLVDGMLERNLQPFLTLYHWDLPAALADKGGWQNRDIAHWFADYSEIVLQNIGDRIETVATINEPWCVAWLSHFEGHHAPGLKDIGAAAHAMHHVLLAHAKSVERMRALGQKNIGIALNFEYAQNLSSAPGDVSATVRFDAIYNRWFLGGLFKGTYPDEALEGLAPHLPDNWADDMAQIQQPIDWLGVNYYTRQLVSNAPKTPWPHYKTSPGDLPQTDMNWEIYPSGLGHFLNLITTDYAPDLPIFITENGMASKDSVQGEVFSDPERWEFIQRHLSEVKDALQLGANIEGFFYWSLLDNFEWAFGYDKRFGLVHVDFDTQKRTPKKSFYQFKDAFST